MTPSAVAIIVKTLPKSITENPPPGTTLQDPFLQSILYKGHHTKKTIPKDIKNILNTGIKYNLTFNTLRLPVQHKLQLPALHHISNKITKNHMNKKATACLQEIHQVSTIEDLSQQENLCTSPNHSLDNKMCDSLTCTNHSNLGC